MRISLSVWSTRIAAQDFTIWRFQLRRLRQKMVKNGLPDPVENVRGRGFRLLESVRLEADHHSVNGLGVQCSK
jgi:DNA-binding winged helix-turn-helix (wHTH) protein